MRQLAAKIKKLSLISISVLALGGSVTSCGKKKSSIKKPTGSALNNATNSKEFECQQSTASCPRVRLALSGRSSLGGQAGALMTWDVGGVAPDDKQRQIVVVMDSTLLTGMETISGPTDSRVSVNWKPTGAQQGALIFRARDMTRCQRLTGGSGNCHDMTVYLDQYDEYLEAPYQVLDKGEVFSAADSDFFRQFHCDKMGMTDAQKAAYSGATIAAGAASGGLSNDGTALGGAATGANYASGGLQEGVAVITDFLVNGESVPTPYQCLRHNSTAEKNTPQVQQTTFNPNASQ